MNNCFALQICNYMNKFVKLMKVRNKREIYSSIYIWFAFKKTWICYWNINEFSVFCV